MNYNCAGVSLNAASSLSKWLDTNHSISGFCSISEHSALPDYYVCGASDGVGTKVIPLYEKKMYRTIAQDLAAMCLNDLVTSGASPFLFMDNIACETFDTQRFKSIINELAAILSEYNCKLSGGETAVLKGIIEHDKIDISGFAMGMVKKESLLSAEKVKKGDLIIALASSGLHSNGFTLIRKLYESGKLSDTEFEQCLTPTTIYVKEILELSEYIHSCANITGGGIHENLARAIPEELSYSIDLSKIERLEIFNKLETILGQEEAYKVFNMGVGFCIVAPHESAEKILSLTQHYNSTIIGEII